MCPAYDGAPRAENETRSDHAPPLTLQRKESNVTSLEGRNELRLEPPGPGTWERNPVHFPRPVTRYWAETHPVPFKRGFGEFTRYYGILLDHLEYRYVAGFPYSTRVPAAENEVPGTVPARRAGLRREAMAGAASRVGRDIQALAFIQIHRELQSIDPDSLSDDELVSHLSRCQEHHSEMIYQHMRFTGAAMLPTGELSRTRRRVDGQLARGAPRPHARLRSRFRRLLRRAAGA